MEGIGIDGFGIVRLILFRFQWNCFSHVHFKVELPGFINSLLRSCRLRVLARIDSNPCFDHMHYDAFHVYRDIGNFPANQRLLGGQVVERHESGKKG
jgi:hypothetical protein